MKTSTSKVLLSLLILFLLTGLVLIFAFPKSVFMDRLLTERGVYLLPSRVEEGIAHVSFEDLKVFFRNEPIGRFNRARVGLSPTGVNLSAICGNGRINARFGIGSLRLDLSSADCFEHVGTASGKLELKENKLRGRLVVRDLVMKNLRIDSLKLTFKGRNFDGEIGYMGMKLVGGGTLKIDPRNIENTEINAEFRGSVGKLIVKGKLTNISVRLR